MLQAGIEVFEPSLHAIPELPKNEEPDSKIN